MGMVELALIGKLKKTKADKSNVLQLNNTTAFTPTQNYHPATKKYVDDLIGSISSTITYYTSATAPVTPNSGDIWFNQTNGITYIYQEDSLGTQFWVELGGGSSAINVPTLKESYLIIVSDPSIKTYNFTYETSFVQVFINRLKLRKSEFTATNGTSVTINIDLELGDEIEIVTVEGI